MSELVVLRFENEQAAEEARRRIVEMKKHRTLHLDDAALAWRDDGGRLHVSQLHSFVLVGALVGFAWGIFVGAVTGEYLVAILASIVAGTVGGYFTDVGVSNAFIHRVAHDIHAHEGELFVMLRGIGDVEMLEQTRELGGYVVRTTLGPAEDAAFRAAWETHQAE